MAPRGTDSGVRAKLLEFNFNKDNEPVFLNSFDYLSGIGDRNFICLITSELSPFVYIFGLDVFFDTRTKSFYEFPESFRAELEPYSYTLFLTTTHILVCMQRFAYPLVSSFIQSFALPPDPSPCPPNRRAELRLTHECLVDDDLTRMWLLRDPIVDSLTGSTNLRFLLRTLKRNEMTLSCVDFRLPRTSDDAILLISFHIYVLFPINLLFPWVDNRPFKLFVEASYDGYIRGFLHGEGES